MLKNALWWMVFFGLLGLSLASIYLGFEELGGWANFRKVLSGVLGIASGLLIARISRFSLEGWGPEFTRKKPR